MRKFLFDVSFDDPDSPRRAVRREPEPPPPPPVAEVEEVGAPAPAADPTFTEAQLIAERNKAYDEGRRAGSEEAWAQFRTQTDQIAVRALRVMGDQLQNLFNQQAGQAEQLHREALQLALTVSGKMLPELARRNALVEVETVIREAVTKLVGEPKVVIRVHPDLAEAVAARLEPMLDEAGFEGRVQLAPDERLATTDSRVEWAGGGLVRDSHRLWQEIDAVIFATLGMHVHAEPVEGPASDTQM